MDDNEVHHQYTHVHIDYICTRRFLDDIHIVQSYDRIGASKIHTDHNRKLEKRLFEFFLRAKLKLLMRVYQNISRSDLPRSWLHTGYIDVLQSLVCTHIVP